jgi:hypothetical protein
VTTQPTKVANTESFVREASATSARPRRSALLNRLRPGCCHASWEWAAPPASPSRRAARSCRAVCRCDGGKVNLPRARSTAKQRSCKIRGKTYSKLFNRLSATSHLTAAGGTLLAQQRTIKRAAHARDQRLILWSCRESKPLVKSL